MIRQPSRSAAGAAPQPGYLLQPTGAWGPEAATRVAADGRKFSVVFR
jgi:hypothetical protein